MVELKMKYLEVALMKTKIILDTCSDINKNLMDEYQFGLVNIITDTKDEFPINNEELGCKNFCDYLRKCVAIPTTSQPSIEDFIDVFKEYENGYDNILYITMSPNGSGTYNGAINAKSIYKEDYNNVNLYVVNSKNTSLAMVHLAILANKMLIDGSAIDEVLNAIDIEKEKMATYYLVDDVKFLAKSGRVSSVKGTIASKLNIKPIIQIKDGIGENPSNALGIDKGINKLVGYYKKQGDNKSCVYITHADEEKRALKLKDGLLTYNRNLKVVITEMNKPMTVHSGPGCIGIFFVQDI